MILVTLFLHLLGAVAIVNRCVTCPTPNSHLLLRGGGSFDHAIIEKLVEQAITNDDAFNDLLASIRADVPHQNVYKRQVKNIVEEDDEDADDEDYSDDVIFEKAMHRGEDDEDDVK